MRALRILPVALAIAAAGCGFFDGDPDDELRDRQRRWDALGITDYSFEFRRACFCGGPHGFLRVLVRQDAIISVTDVQTGAPPENLPAGWVGTIDEIFAELLREADRADAIDVQFDGTFHFPTTANVDRIKNAIDDEFGLTLGSFLPMR